MNNPLLILQTLDRHLDHPVELTLYGRAALALGFPAHEPRHATTQDVDAIIPLGQLDELRARLPDIQELRDAFRAAQPKVLALPQPRERGGPPTA